MAKIVVVQRVIPHYRVRFFTDLESLLDLKVLNTKGPKVGVQNIDNLEFDTVGSFFFGKSEYGCFINVFEMLAKYRPAVVVHEFGLSIVSNYLLVILSFLCRFKIVWWGHFTPKTRVSRVKACLSKFLVSRASACITYSDRGEQYVHENFPGVRTFVAYNTLDTEKLAKLKRSLVKPDGSSFNFVFVGRLIESKEPLAVLQLFKRLKQEYSNIRLHIVGDGPLMAVLTQFMEENNLEDVSLLGSITDDSELSDILNQCDIALNPGTIGLNIVHYYMFDLPVVLQKPSRLGPMHGPELGYFVDGQNGFFFRNKDYDDFYEKTKIFLSNPAVGDEMRRYISQTTSANCSYGNMVQGFLDALCYVDNQV